MHKVCAVIQISEFDESPEQAISSVLENKDYFSGVVMVKHAYSSQIEPYPGFFADQKELTDSNIPLVWQSQLDVTKLPSEARAIVRIEPDVRVADGALKALIQDMTNSRQEHCAVSSILCLETASPADPRVWFSSLPYGFLLVILMLDTFRSLANLFGYNRTCDVRGQLMTITYPNRVELAPNRWWRFWIGTGVARTRYGGDAAIQLPDEKDQGMNFVFRTIKTHNHMSIGIWILFYALYYFAFAFPFWNTFLSPHSVWGRWLVRDMTALYWMIPYTLHLALVGVVAWLYVEFPLTHFPLVGPRSVILPLQVLLFNFYLTASPLIFLYGRFHVSRASWARTTATLKKTTAAIKRRAREVSSVSSVPVPSVPVPARKGRDRNGEKEAKGKEETAMEEEEK